MPGQDLSVSPAHLPVTKPDQSGHGYYVRSYGARLCLSRCSDRLVQPPVLSHRVSITMEAEFCIEALQEALANMATGNLQLGSGSQFTSADFTSVLLKTHRHQHGRQRLVA